MFYFDPSMKSSVDDDALDSSNTIDLSYDNKVLSEEELKRENTISSGMNTSFEEEKVEDTDLTKLFR